MSIDIIPRYFVLSGSAVTEPSNFYVLDQAESPARTAAVCPTRGDAERARAGLELLHVLELSAGEPIEIAAPNPAWAGS